jgi:hypothetical protein
MICSCVKGGIVGVLVGAAVGGLLYQTSRHKNKHSMTDVKIARDIVSTELAKISPDAAESLKHVARVLVSNKSFATHRDVMESLVKSADALASATSTSDATREFIKCDRCLLYLAAVYKGNQAVFRPLVQDAMQKLDNVKNVIVSSRQPPSGQPSV